MLYTSPNNQRVNQFLFKFREKKEQTGLPEQQVQQWSGKTGLWEET